VSELAGTRQRHVRDVGKSSQQAAIADDDDARAKIRILQAQADLGTNPCRLA